MYTIAEIKLMQAQAAAWQLKYPAEFIDMTPEDLSGILNGYGPDRWSDEVRKKVSWFFRHYPVPAAIHDLRYEFSDGLECTRKAADSEFAANLLIVWQKRYGFFRYINPVALYERLKLDAAIQLTRHFGRPGWVDAWKKHRTAEVAYE